jgi:hypothetical protein
MMNTLLDGLPEVGDLDKPKMALFFDEAHLLFADMPGILLSKIERIVRLIRSKGVGIYFITQSPADIPETILAQLGNRIQHVLRSYTPKDQRAIRAAAASFRKNPAIDTVEVLGELGIGEALISLLDANGVPNIVERADILPPQSYIGTDHDRLMALSDDESSLMEKYSVVIDNRKTAKHISTPCEKSASDKSGRTTNRNSSKRHSAVESDIQSIMSGVQRLITSNTVDNLVLSATKLATESFVDGAFRKLEQFVHRSTP